MRKMRMYRALGTFTLLGLLSPCLMYAADPGAGTWDRLDRLHAGQKIEVLKQDSEMVKGNFVVFSADSVALQLRDGDVKIDRADVREIRVSSGMAGWKRALIGTAIVGTVAGTAGLAGFIVASPLCVLGVGVFRPGYSVIYNGQQ